MNLNLVRTSLVALFALALLVVAGPVGPVRAASVDECQAKIAALRTATLNATFFGRNADQDQAGLVGKLDAASSKLAQGKTADALQALTQFRDKVAALDAQGKLNHEDATNLIAGANDAIACVQSLSAG